VARLSRFERDYELTVTVDGRSFVVTPPMRIAFDADKSIRGGLNKLTCKVYNLQESKRLALVKDAEQQRNIQFSLKVGYEGDLRLIFSGSVFTGENSRDGADIVTTLDSIDGGFDFLNSFTSRTVRRGELTVDEVLKDTPNTRKGKVTAQRPTVRPKVLVGNSYRLLDSVVGEDETLYIDNGQVFILKDTEVVSRFIPEVSAETGLISTPSRKANVVTFETLMNPTVIIGGLCKLTSVTAPHLNAVYRVETINFSGDNYGQDWKQTCTCLLAPSYEVL
jgi:hypothetical protein